MKIHDPFHALILFDQKKLIPRKTILRTSSGSTFKFIRVDTQLNWPRVIVEDSSRVEMVLQSKDVQSFQFETEEPLISIEDFQEIP